MREVTISEIISTQIDIAKLYTRYYEDQKTYLNNGLGKEYFL